MAQKNVSNTIFTDIPEFLANQSYWLPRADHDQSVNTASFK